MGEEHPWFSPAAASWLMAAAAWQRWEFQSSNYESSKLPIGFPTTTDFRKSEGCQLQNILKYQHIGGYRGDIWDISWGDLGEILGISRAYQGDISGISGEYLGDIWGISGEYLGFIWGIWGGYLGNVPPNAIKEQLWSDCTALQRNAVSAQINFRENYNLLKLFHGCE